MSRGRVVRRFFSIQVVLASLRPGGSLMKKLLAVAAAVVALVVVKRKKGRDSAAVWREATRSS